MCVCYPTIYDITMLVLVVYKKIVVKWKNPFILTVSLNWYFENLINKQCIYVRLSFNGFSPNFVRKHASGHHTLHRLHYLDGHRPYANH
jgi:hypothetical protein